MTYSFRIRFNRSPTDTIQTDATELLVPVPDKGVSVALRNPEADQPIKDAEQLALHGSGYSSDEEATEAGERYQLALMVALARVRVGADFGNRAAKGAYTEHGLKWLEQQIGQRVLNSVHGMMVFRSDPKPRFALTNAKMVRGTNADVFQAVLLDAIEKQPSLTEQEKLAFSLFNASFFQPTADSRFLLLLMAVEALIEPALRSSEVRDHVHQLIAQTQTAAIPDVEKDSMLGALPRLLRESINQAGKRLVSSRLGNRRYSEKPATDFFSHCYQLRSNLVHGVLPYPTFEEVGNVAGTLEVFVSDLLTSPVLGHPQ